jgi:hypothetical protein
MSEGIGQVAVQIEKLVREQMRTTALEVKGEPSGFYYLTGPDGKAQLMEAKHSRHCEQLATPEQLAEFACDAIGKSDRIASPIILISGSEVVFVYSAKERRDFARCPLTLSKQFRTLEQWQATTPLLTQREMIQALRITFRGNVVNGNLLPIVRQMKFEQNANGASTIQHGSEQMGRNLVAKVMGAEAIPEEFALDIPIFDECRGLRRVECALDVDVQSQRFTVIPFPQQLQIAQEVTLEGLADYFAEKVKIPAFIGRPFPQ